MKDVQSTPLKRRSFAALTCKWKLFSRPFMCYKDASNACYLLYELHSVDVYLFFIVAKFYANLCTEIIKYSSPDSDEVGRL